MSGVRNIDSIWPILHAFDDMKEIFQNKPMIPYRRQKNIRIIWLGEGSTDKGMKKCGKSRCQIRLRKGIF